MKTVMAGHEAACRHVSLVRFQSKCPLVEARCWQCTLLSSGVSAKRSDQGLIARLSRQVDVLSGFSFNVWWQRAHCMPSKAKAVE